MLKACLNGARLPAEHPALPVTAEQVAADTVAVLAAGADMVHVHVKDDVGRDTFAAGTLARTLEATRAAAPDVRIGVTTGAWAEPSLARRLEAVSSWTSLPDFASVNWHEEGAEPLAGLLLDRGVGVEAGLWTVDAVRAWLDSPLAGRCLRVLLELPDESDEVAVLSTADRMIDVLRTGGADRSVLLHGEGAATWPVLRHARRLGLDTRIGLEDTLVLPDGSTAPGNAALVAAARAAG